MASDGTKLNGYGFSGSFVWLLKYDKHIQQSWYQTHQL